MNFDELIRKILKILGTLFWILILILMARWYFQNRDRFFPPSPPIKEIHNINPFKF
ncbi:MAG: hypothetical protein NZ822_01990 [Patescibacteria group bacterium]|nr:hypothetical protein [Patescibacteria group bacterium]